MKPFMFATAVAAALAASVSAQQDLVARARAIHERVIALDTHNDIDPANFTADCNYTMRLTTQVNLPKMVEGDYRTGHMRTVISKLADARVRPSGKKQTARTVRSWPFNAGVDFIVLASMMWTSL